MQIDERERTMRKIRDKAKKRVRQAIGFRWHALLYFMVNAALIAIDLRYTPDTLWFVWPLGTWTAGLSLHAFAAFQGGAMSERMIEAEVEREMARYQSAA